MGSSRNSAVVLATLVMGAVLGAAGCDTGDGGGTARPSDRASERSDEGPASSRPDPTRTVAEPTRTEAPEPTRTRDPEPTTEPADTPTRRTTSTKEPTRTATTTTPAEATTTTRPPTTAAAAPEPARTTTAAGTTPPTTTPAASASAAVAAAGSQGVTPFGWLVLITLGAAMLVGGLLLYRSQRKSAWDTEARALESETRTVTATRLPPVLTTTTTSRRGLAWPPVRAGLTDLVSRWNNLAERALGEPRRNWSVRLSGQLQDVIAAVDAENAELAAGRDWMLLRPRVNEAERALAATLANQPQPEPPPAAEPGPPAFQA